MLRVVRRIMSIGLNWLGMIVGGGRIRGGG